MLGVMSVKKEVFQPIYRLFPSSLVGQLGVKALFLVSDLSHEVLKREGPQRHLLPPAFVQALVDSQLQLLSHNQAALQWLFVGLKRYPKLLAIGDTVSLPLDVEDNGVTMLLVLGQAGRDELHELTVLLPDILLFPLLSPAATGV